MHIVESAQGVERYMSMLLPLLEKRYEQYLVCSMKFEPDNYTKIVDKVVQLDMKRSLSLFRICKTLFLIRKEIKKEEPDILYCHSSFGGVFGRVAAIGLHCKIVYNPHGWAFNMK